METPSLPAVNAIARYLRQGTVATRPEDDAEIIALAARRHRLRSEALRAAAADIQDYQRRPETPLGRVVFRVWGDQGAAVLGKAADILDSKRIARA